MQSRSQNIQRIRSCAKVTVFVASTLIVIIFIYQLINERHAYNVYSQNLESATEKIQRGMGREEAERIVGAPPDDFRIAPGQDASGYTLYWEAGKHQGCIMAVWYARESKGHYGLAIGFDRDGSVSSIYGGVN